MLPDMGVSSFLGDTNYHRPMRPGVHAPLEVKGIRWVAVTKIRAQEKCEQHEMGGGAEQGNWPGEVSGEQRAQLIALSEHFQKPNLGGTSFKVMID